MQVQSLCWEEPLVESLATQSRILAWRIPLTEEAGGQQSMVFRVRHNLSDLAHMHSWLTMFC